MEDTFYTFCLCSYNSTAIRNCKREIQKYRKVVQSEATGFINIYGLPTKVQAIVNNEKEGK